jgi:hypothetical protein
LLEGVAAALRTHVEPHVTDRFAQMQLRAIDELLRNLAGRTEWSLPELNAEIEDGERLLRELASAGGPGATTDSGQGAGPFPSAEEALSYRGSLLTRLAEGVAWAQSEGPPEARAAASEYLRAYNTLDRKQLKSGMYS